MMPGLIRRAGRRAWHTLFVAPIDFDFIALEELLAGSPDLPLNLRAWNEDLRAGCFLDTIVLAALARALAPRLCFEIGTGHGRSALQFAANTPADTVIYTLEAEDNPVKGSVFRNRPEAAKIRQLCGNSQTFAFDQWLGTVDLVFVDASHEFDCVRHDTEVAFRLLAPNGVILWHDVSTSHPGVVKALRECPQARFIRRIAHTDYGYYKAPAGSPAFPASARRYHSEA